MSRYHYPALFGSIFAPKKKAPAVRVAVVSGYDRRRHSTTHRENVARIVSIAMEVGRHDYAEALAILDRAVERHAGADDEQEMRDARVLLSRRLNTMLGGGR